MSKVWLSSVCEYLLSSCFSKFYSVYFLQPRTMYLFYLFAQQIFNENLLCSPLWRAGANEHAGTELWFWSRESTWLLCSPHCMFTFSRFYLSELMGKCTLFLLSLVLVFLLLMMLNISPYSLVIDLICPVTI